MSDSEKHNWMTAIKNQVYASLTVMLSVMVGGKKLTPFVILNRKNLVKERILSGIIFKHTGKGLMTEELTLQWLREVWDRRAGALLKMLLLDSLKDI